MLYRSNNFIIKMLYLNNNFVIFVENFIMEKLFIKSNAKIKQISTGFKRYLLNEIYPGNRISIIKGARGVGKTTLLLQFARLKMPKDKNVLYVSLDDLFFLSNNLYQLAEEFYKDNGSFLLLDEVHKYPNWSRELKLIYDDFHGLQLLVTSSSLLEIYKSESDLSRRAVTYSLKELSFREFLYFEKNVSFPVYSLDDIINHHIDISYEITAKIKPIHEFKKYLQYGIYPYFLEGKKLFQEKLLQTINLTLETDLPAVERIDFEHVVKIKKLLFAIASSAPFTPNITKLSERTGMSRNGLLKALHYLEKAGLINLVNKNNKGISILSKPDKIFINNPNLQWALTVTGEPNLGSIRESFFVHQLKGLHKINLATKGDFIVDDTYNFEIGGKNKTNYQIKGLKNAFIVRDDFENGYKNYIPLWLFGFLY